MLFMQDPTPKSRSQIAKSLGLKKTPYITTHIESLVSSGNLIKVEGRWTNGCVMYFYQLANQPRH
jgi:hypothetical protein